MATAKKFLLYIVMLIGFMLITNFLIFLGLNGKYKNIEKCQIIQDDYKIELIEAKAGYARGHVEGKIKSTSESLKENVYVKVDLYTADGEYRGTEYYDIRYFYPNEEIRFKVVFNYENVQMAKIELVNTKPETTTFEKIIDKVEDWWPIAGFTALLLYLGL